MNQSSQNQNQNALTTTTGQVPESQSLIRPGFGSAASFALLRNMANVFASSTIVPVVYRGNAGNALIACHMAERLRIDPLTVMQNLHPINGRPSWSSQFLIAMWNSCGRFSPMRFEFDGTGDDFGCRAKSIELETGEKLIGTKITWKMVKAEGWSSRSGSKWATMPEQMFQYRAAAFLVRTYAPELTLGLHSAEECDELPDAGKLTQSQQEAYQKQMEHFQQSAAIAERKALEEASNAGSERMAGMQAAGMQTSGTVSGTTSGTAGKEAVTDAVMDAEYEPRTAEQKTSGNGAATGGSQGSGNGSMDGTGQGVSAPNKSTAVTVDPAAVPQCEQKDSGRTEAPDPAPAKAAVQDIEIQTTSHDEAVCKETLQVMRELLKKLDPPQDMWKSILAKYGASKASELSETAAHRIIAGLQKRLDQKELDQWSATATTGKGARPAATAEAAPFH